ncbi:hypothetical protein M406DRAFT_356892 [Cryphonectria parasitica EP155]|uniref:Cell cycle control protein n=1 Tax=Cryphonectria parasitica (strain ATCC 38755 / EP155) TaxID=660469 RepID=A0A9P5CNA3_CRYP1|nr:uncharacterized protein M406DRAFT_356892 [Cryphonectria parasitica EP155]KAF3765244.1 hypothetical protein M406DRAFT_356892 [Cryphonectria parasitica EP155]
MNANPLAGNQPEFNYQANGFGGLAGRQPTPKPDFEPPPPARPGFTRHTGPDRDTNDEMVVVCASCDNELKYSAAAADDDGARPAKRPRNKKDREEHHFWAVKGCGHVYCRDCYENRRKYKSKDYDKLGFRVNYSYKTPKVFCAVDACDSDVTNNQSWVGIFI